MKVTNIKDKIYYSELIEFYNKNRRKIHRLLDVTENKNIMINGKKYRVTARELRTLNKKSAA